MNEPIDGQLRVRDTRWDTALKLGSATLHEAAGGIGALPAAIHSITTGLHVAGPAVTVSGPPGDNLWVHRALYACRPGDVLVISVGGAYESGYWGEILGWAASARGLGGVVLDGCVRDSGRLSAIGVPVFARGLCIRATTKQSDGPGRINGVLAFGSAEVRPRDLIVGDEDGLVVLPAERIDEVLAKGQARLEREAHIIGEVRGGARTLDVYGWSDAGP
jgi:4-hydroxy-4-methyl-2-oxoglutarate aldolase